ncbi:DUF3173 domain-containing protein [Lacticaseibacillus paracasei]|jgi:hypothetical protein|uniref:DUF3173 domain-containing protein n=1 Tax=Lacticaseibacillus paracasei subsp. paracasei Lpp22 TaxID=1256221 RepID=A0A8E0IBV1_LACPA|nr:DUF3173 domain-containing protein [Lacticaseibacillus paracasei]EPC32971.1 hypothetical protein Lpp22_0273 [Lacticaseibacillus paracasei subsp. paracasei Lpp22]EKQ20486.1 hypothetical protein LCAUW1_1934 [Lacticaseibacillus paracasei]MDE5157097.1 DUF3173 domain-containing protein [Lacticaseibacillus paracasei]MDM7550316.1 DUF3173 domain-containing protein [Lacticaseibacillus paracasei]MDS0815831.1 DUF3173 domain-containing protein [Lacticaseibacillus paracasei]
MENNTVTKKDLISLGYRENTAAELIRQAKRSMVQQGYEFYTNRRLGRVPVAAVEAIIGASIRKDADDAKD